jgi:hypothetical protein
LYNKNDFLYNNTNIVVRRRLKLMDVSIAPTVQQYLLTVIRGAACTCSASRFKEHACTLVPAREFCMHACMLFKYAVLLCLDLWMIVWTLILKNMSGHDTCDIHVCLQQLVVGHFAQSVDSVPSFAMDANEDSKDADHLTSHAASDTNYVVHI